MTKVKFNFFAIHRLQRFLDRSITSSQIPTQMESLIDNIVKLDEEQFKHATEFKNDPVKYNKKYAPPKQ